VTDRFPTTRWSIILAAKEADDAGATQALESLCRSYWLPLYAFARRRGDPPEAAQDRVQGYFAELIERRVLHDARPHKGRFRAFLLHTMKHYLINERQREAALKRGGAAIFTSLDAEQLEQRYGKSVAEQRTPESEYERQWALTVIDHVMQRLERDAAKNSRSAEFARMRGFLTDGGERGDYGVVAAELSMSEGTVRVAVHSLRQRFGQFLREEIADTVDDPDDVDDEIRSLFAAL